MVSLVEKMYNSQFAWPSLVLSNIKNVSGLEKAKALKIPTICVEPDEVNLSDLRFESVIQKELQNLKYSASIRPIKIIVKTNIESNPVTTDFDLNIW